MSQAPRPIAWMLAAALIAPTPRVLGGASLASEGMGAGSLPSDAARAQPHGGNADGLGDTASGSDGTEDDSDAAWHIDGDGDAAWDADWDLESRIAAVNEGDLRFLAPEAAAQAHGHINRIRIDAASLRGGWIGLHQCHERLDAVPAAQIVFGRGRIRHLRVESAEGIGRAWVEGHTVQLENVGPAARLCIAGESRALESLGEGRWRLRNGPYLRRFLDGYYPLRVRLEIDWPPELLDLAGTVPPPQPGFSLDAAPGRIEVDATFEGRLFTCVDFRSVGGETDSRIALETAAPCPGTEWEGR